MAMGNHSNGLTQAARLLVPKDEQQQQQTLGGEKGCSRPMPPRAAELIDLGSSDEEDNRPSSASRAPPAAARDAAQPPPARYLAPAPSPQLVPLETAPVSGPGPGAGIGAKVKQEPREQLPGGARASHTAPARHGGAGTETPLPQLWETPVPSTAGGAGAFPEPGSEPRKRRKLESHVAAPAVPSGATSSRHVAGPGGPSDGQASPADTPLPGLFGASSQPAAPPGSAAAAPSPTQGALPPAGASPMAPPAAAAAAAAPSQTTQSGYPPTLDHDVKPKVKALLGASEGRTGSPGVGVAVQSPDPVSQPNGSAPAHPTAAPDNGANGAANGDLADPKVPRHRQFWQAGDYEVSQKVTRPSSGGIEHTRVHPRFLHSNATSHKWALGAMAELLDNSMDEVNNGATFCTVDQIPNPSDGQPMLVVEDDGGGMSPERMRSCVSLGYTVKSKKANTIGQYGNGFKTSTMRLGADVIVFSCSPHGDGTGPTQTIGMLSYTYLRSTGLEDTVVPMIDYSISAPSQLERLLRGSREDWAGNLETITTWSPFKSEEALLQQFGQMGPQGTRIVVYNLWYADDGHLELDFEADPRDIQVRGPREEKKLKLAEQYPNSRHFITYRHSLRSYASILYLRRPRGFRIVLRGEEVEHHSLVDDLMFIEEVTYRPQGGDEKKSGMMAAVTLGFVKDAKAHIDVQGFNVYHKNRLIKPLWRIWTAASSRGRGIVGVLEADFVEPAHDKQGFERTQVLQRLETRLLAMQKHYWKMNAHRIGYGGWGVMLRQEVAKGEDGTPGSMSRNGHSPAGGPRSATHGSPSVKPEPADGGPPAAPPDAANHAAPHGRQPHGPARHGPNFDPAYRPSGSSHRRSLSAADQRMADANAAAGRAVGGAPSTAFGSAEGPSRRHHSSEHDNTLLADLGRKLSSEAANAARGGASPPADEEDGEGELQELVQSEWLHSLQQEIDELRLKCQDLEASQSQRERNLLAKLKEAEKRADKERAHAEQLLAQLAEAKRMEALLKAQLKEAIQRNNRTAGGGTHK